MNCKDKISSTCGKKVNAKCVDYEGEYHSNTNIEPCDKPSVEDVIEDINSHIDTLSDSMDLSSLGKDCIEYTKEGEELKAKEAFLALEAKICEIADFVGLPKPGCESCDNCSPIFDLDINCAGLNLGALVDECGEQPKTLKELLQLIIDQVNR